MTLPSPKFKRILLKLSGEALMGGDAYGINRQTISEIVSEIKDVVDMGVQVGVVIGGATVITKDLSLDSLAVMDMVMELEDRFDISIPLNTLADIHTVDQLADTILRIRAK